ncbi:hypothetical protein BRM1_12880 [Brevibacterium sp. BRM-1]|uniref:hypothetical protein n=1 Tax=Brevibacterium sp. BRM-1 TaxID=2999062 RepID=UPI0022813476|nr:hypothetical protein [Brevibacterium sp. BRM-1]WAL40105.1 hypothetical protein BRM1_12880 [Brevibacterium sp. BRM-1]
MTAHSLVRVGSSRLKSAVRAVTHWAARKTAGNTAGTAKSVLISDGQNLNIDARLRPGLTPAEFAFVSAHGKKLLTLRAAHRGAGEVTVYGNLSLLPRRGEKARFFVAVRSGEKWHRLDFYGNKSFQNGDVVVQYPASSNGYRAQPAIDRRGHLAVDVIPVDAGVSVHGVAVKLYRIHILLSSHYCAVKEIQCRLRGTDVSLSATVKDSTNAVGMTVLTLPLEEMARHPRVGERGESDVWRLAVRCPDDWRPLRMHYTDLSNPRHSLRYPTVMLAALPGRPRFRPYWNVNGDLVVEHLHPSSQREGDRQ